MQTFFSRQSPLPARWLVTLLLLASAGVAQAQLPTPTVINLLPRRNARSAPRTGRIEVTFTQPISAATAGSIRLHGSQGRGRMNYVLSGGGSASLALQPTAALVPGEVVSVTVPLAARSLDGVSAATQVYQFTAAAAAGPGQFRGTHNAAVGARPRALAAADVDADGDVDVLTANETGNSVSVRLNDGQGLFAAGSEVSVGNLPLAIVAADVDGDGDLDLLTANNGGNSVSVRFNGGNGTFSGTTDTRIYPNINPSNSVYPLALAAGDLDADGDVDFVVADNSSATLMIRFNDGSGHFSGTNEVRVTGAPYGLALADVDADGDLDVLASDQGGVVSIRLNDSRGGFSGTTDLRLPPYYLVGIVTGDLDGDDDADLVTINASTNQAHVRFNDGTGTFGTGIDLPLGGNSPGYAALADVDGDGDLDLFTDTGADNSVLTWLNNGQGSFARHAAVAVGAGPSGIASADVDGDGDLDLLVSATDANVVSVRLNESQPTATRPGRLVWQVYPNPAHDELTVPLPARPTTVELRNALGQLVNPPQVWDAKQLRLNTSALAPGMYWLRLQVGAELASCPVVIQ